MSARLVCEVEDDFHCMVVEIHHDGVKALEVAADMRRAPWTTCPGARQQLKETFIGLPLDQFPTRGQKKANCTHLYDLALLAAGHALDKEPLILDIFVSDPVDGKRSAEVHRGDECLVSWTEQNMQILEPEEFRNMSLFGDLRPWIEGMSAERQEAVKLLRWACMIAHGRQIPVEDQSDASKMPPNCYTFQPERAVVAVRVGEIKDFSDGSTQPLEDFNSVV